MRCVALACAAAVAAAPPPLFAESALSAAAALQRALPYDASLCRRAQGAKLVACTERLLVERINAWLAWHVPFRRASDPATCARFCATAVGDEQFAFVYQGHKRLRKGYGNHVFASLNALLGAILSNSSAVLGLDEATCELNTPHLGYDDDAVWTMRSLRARVLSCGCDGAPEVPSTGPLWHAAKDMAHLRGLSPGARWPLAVNPSVGLGVRDLLRRYSAWTPPPYAVCAVGNDCAARGEHFLSVALEELLATPNAYGLLAYVFLRPTREVAAFAANAINARPFDVGVHVRVNLHDGVTSHGSSTMNGTEKEWRLDPLNAQWAKNLVAQQLPRLRRSGYANSEWLLFVSDQPRVAKGLAARAQGAPDIGSAAHFDAAADAALWSATARENDGRFMIHSSDWGPGPRWAAVAEIFVLSAAQQAVACAGPYSPSSFCELAAALAAVRRALIRRPATLDPLFFLQIPDDTPSTKGRCVPPSSTARVYSNVVWCPASTPSGKSPKCCEAVVLQ